MKRLLIACLLAVLAAPAFAVIGTVDDVPAATLLLPYFEVDLDDPNGVTTLMSINNASATAILAHVVLWTDLSVHILDFNVYLTGYDVQSINLRDILVDGNLPVTASAGQDPGDTISPHGPASQDINFATCNNILAYDNPALSADYIDHVQLMLTGQGSPYFGFNGACGGYDHGDRIARGYVTVDTVNACNTTFPSDPGYFGPGGFVTNQNVLWGDYFYVNAGENFAQGETLVHVEANDQLGAANYTFYYRYSALNGVPGGDQREGLGNIFAVRYLNGGAFDGGSSLLTWRDSKRNITQFNCNLGFPAPFPLGQNDVVVFDEEENFETPEGCTISPCPTEEGLIPFPFEAQRTDVGSAALPSSYDFGWIFLNLNSTVAGSLVPYEPLMQNWVSVVMDAQGRFSVGFDAMQLGNVTDPATAGDPCIGCFF